MCILCWLPCYAPNMEQEQLCRSFLTVLYVISSPWDCTATRRTLHMHDKVGWLNPVWSQAFPLLILVAVLFFILFLSSFFLSLCEVVHYELIGPTFYDLILCFLQLTGSGNLQISFGPFQYNQPTFLLFLSHLPGATANLEETRKSLTDFSSPQNLPYFLPLILPVVWSNFSSTLIRWGKDERRRIGVSKEILSQLS